VQGEGPAGDYGIVFSGGGALGAWEVGCYDAIRSRHRDTQPTVVAGASAGALNAVGICAGMSAQELESLWSGVQPEDVYRRKFGWRVAGLICRSLWKGISATVQSVADAETSFLDSEPLAKTLTNILHPYFAPFQRSAISCAISLTNLTSGQGEIFYKLPPGRVLPEAAKVTGLYSRKLWTPITGGDQLVQVLMGSTALPILFPPFVGYFDGGILLNQPISPAIALGATTLYVIIPTPKILGKTDNIGSTASTVLSVWLSASLVSQFDTVCVRNEIRRTIGEPLIKICVIRPLRDLTDEFGVGLLNFGKNVKALVDHGRSTAHDRLNTFDSQNPHTWF
jgi:NTE family protein